MGTISPEWFKHERMSLNLKGCDNQPRKRSEWVMLGALWDSHSTQQVSPLRPPGWRPLPHHLWICQCPRLHTTCSLCFYHGSLRSLCVTCVCLYWLSEGVSPNKPGIVDRHKCVWVTPFRNAPLSGHLPTAPHFPVRGRYTGVKYTWTPGETWSQEAYTPLWAAFIFPPFTELWIFLTLYIQPALLMQRLLYRLVPSP